MRQARPSPGAVDLTCGPGYGEVGGLFVAQELMRTLGEDRHATPEGQVSLRAEVPEPLLEAMRSFLNHHPNWDQYRLVQAALAGFLVQHGSRDRAVTRCYLANIVPAHRGFDAAPAALSRGRQPIRTTRAAP